ACGEATYPIRLATSRTRSRVSGDTRGSPRSARETVAVETPSSRATSLIPVMGSYFRRRGRTLPKAARSGPSLPDHVGEPVVGPLGGTTQRGPVHADQPERLGVPVGPLEVVHRRPPQPAADVGPGGPSRIDSCQVRA